MRIAIMTQPLGKNYGGIMQAWALQQVLKNSGHEPVTIDRRPDVKSPFYHALRYGYRTIQKVVGKRKTPINFEQHYPTILKHTDAFIRKNLSMSEQLHSTKRLSDHFDREQYDMVIVGSDQTWRPQYSPNIGNFFLDFIENVSIRRISYASSFGVDKWEFSEEETKRCAFLAKRFDAISVREASGIDLCRKHLGVGALHVLDPTMLLDQKAYRKLYENKDFPKRQGVYTYILDPADWKERVVTTVLVKLQKSRYRNQPKLNMSQVSSKDVSDYEMPSIEGWIKGFDDADFVITDSFHGTVFSIIFNKQFISLVNSQRGGARFSSMLTDLGLQNRLLPNFHESTVEEILSTPIDYESVNEKLAVARKKSKDFLAKALN